MRRGLAALAAGLSILASAEAVARDLGTGPLPIRIDAVEPMALDAGEELQIEGVVEAASPVVVVLRIDDMQSWSYASRFNGERTLPPGPFRWTLAAKGLRAPDGRQLDHTQVRRVIFFVAAGEGNVTLRRFETVPAKPLPEGAKGYALGAVTAEFPGGFERIAPGDPRIGGGNVVAVQRPAPDPLIASGLRGIERLTLPWPAGRARVTIWAEDPGEWELLPHPLERRIRINGTDVVSERLTPEDWVQRRYLRGLDTEHGAGDDAWTAYGRLRGGMHSVEVETGADGVVIELAGSSASALYLSAVVIEPAGSKAGRNHAEALRIYPRDRSAFTIEARTANGPIRLAPVMLDEIRIDRLTIASVPAVVSEGAQERALLGMNFLRQLNRFEVRNGELVME